MHSVTTMAYSPEFDLWPLQMPSVTSKLSEVNDVGVGGISGWVVTSSCFQVTMVTKVIKLTMAKVNVCSHFWDKFKEKAMLLRKSSRIFFVMKTRNYLTFLHPRVIFTWIVWLIGYLVAFFHWRCNTWSNGMGKWWLMWITKKIENYQSVPNAIFSIFLYLRHSYALIILRNTM